MTPEDVSYRALGSTACDTVVSGDGVDMAASQLPSTGERLFTGHTELLGAAVSGYNVCTCVRVKFYSTELSLFWLVYVVLLGVVQVQSFWSVIHCVAKCKAVSSSHV